MKGVDKLTMSKRVTEETSSTVDTNEVLQGKQDKEFQSISDVCEQSLIMILDKISENQKKLMKSRSELYATYFSVTSDIIRKSFNGPIEMSYNLSSYSNPSKKYEEEIAKSYKGAQEILENSMRLNNKLILDTIDLAVSSNRLYFSTLMTNFAMYPPPLFKA